MENIIFWSGLNSIGSNIFSLDNGKNRLVMDFGMPNEEYSGIKEESVVEALINEGKLPTIPYLYDTSNFIQEFPGIHESKFEEQAVFISHLHLDHNAGLKYLPKDTKVYMSDETKKMYEYLLEAGMEAAIDATLIGVPFNEQVTVGDYKVSFISNDHDTIGTSSILIEAADKRILHSGDIRKNGYHPGNIDSLIKGVKPIDLLLIEGTSFSFPDEETVESKQRTEQDLLDDFEKLLLDNTGNIVINPYPRNIDRLIKLNELSIKLKRPILWTNDYAKLLECYTDENVHMWTSLEDTKDGVIQVHFDDIESLNYLKAGIYLHMNGEPLGEYDPRYSILLNTLEKYNFTFANYSVSGHGTKEDILNIVENINPKIVVPWHTFEPEIQGAALERRGMNVFLPELRKDYNLDDLCE